MIRFFAVRTLLAISLGGALGSVARYLLQTGLQAKFAPGSAAGAGWLTRFPVGTLTVNLVGCLAIGLLAALWHERLDVDATVRGFVFVGLLGGFTTFSAFGLESFDLLRAGNIGLALLYAGASVFLGLGAVAFGHAIGSRF